jgi:putative inorganic carbon (hco3(-)) transporter
MSSLWQNLMLLTWPYHQWQRASLMHRWVGLLQGWRRGSVVMPYAEAIGGGLIALVFALAPFLPNTDLIGVLLGACGAYWLLLTLSDDQVGSVQQPRFAGLTTPVHLLVLLYWGVSVVAAGLSPVRQAALVGVGKLSLYLLFFLLAARVLRSQRVRSVVITIYLLVALAVSAYGLQQWFSGTAALATWVDPESPLSKITRVYSYLGNPNLLAGYLVPAFTFSIVGILAWRSWACKALAVLMTVVNGACLILTFSRAGWIGMFVAGLTLVVLLAYWWSVRLPGFWRTSAIPVAVGGLVAVVLLAMLVLPPFRDRVISMFAGRGDSSNNFRINVWTAVLEMIRARPILGIGPGNVAFNQIYPIYQRARYSALSAYSILLEVAVETGFVGVISFLWLLLVTFNLGLTTLHRLRTIGDSTGLWLLGAIATLLGMLSHGMFDTVLYRPQVNTLWWLMFALIASYYSQPERFEGSEEPEGVSN